MAAEQQEHRKRHGNVFTPERREARTRRLAELSRMTKQPDRMPTLRDLANRFGVSHEQIRLDLVQLGYRSQRRGRGRKTKRST